MKLNILLSISLSMAGVILCLSLLFALFGKRIRASSRYLIWVAVLIRLAIPYGLPQLPRIYTVEIPAAQVKSIAEGLSGALPAVAGTQIRILPSADTPGLSESGTGTERKIPLTTLLAALYFTAGGAYFLLSLLMHGVYVWRIRRGRTLGEEDIYPIYADVCRQSGIGDPPLLWVSGAADSPMIIGFFTPRIVLPDGLSEEALPGILSHELTHFHRRDLWVKFLCLIVKSLHWWNPAVWYATYRATCEMELSCDDRVLRGLDEEKRRDYGMAMLAILQKCRRRGIALTTHFSPRRADVKARFAGIMDCSSKAVGTWMIVFSMLLCLAAGVLFGYTFGQWQTPSLPELPAYAALPTETVHVTETDAPVQTDAPLETDAPLAETTAPVSTQQKQPQTIPEAEMQIGMRMYEGYTVKQFSTSQKQVRTQVEFADQTVETLLPAELVERFGTGVVTFADVDFDGTDDLLLLQSSEPTEDGETQTFACWRSVGGRYVYTEGFEQIHDPILSEETLIREAIGDGMERLWMYFNGAWVILDTRKTPIGSVFYSTDFSDDTVLDDFVGYRGTWSVRDGRLWLEETETETASALLYFIGKDTSSLEKYRVDVDIYNLCTQTGLLIRCDPQKMNGKSANSFYGYFGFISSDLTQSAIGVGDKNGNWGGNLALADANLRVGDNVHLTVIADGPQLTCTVTGLLSGRVLSECSFNDPRWSAGAFGIRMLGSNGLQSSMNTTSFDNLTVTVLE